MNARPKGQHRELTRIHLLWAGPHTFGDVLEIDGPSDYGIYQVYGPHPANATESLLYIGQGKQSDLRRQVHKRRPPAVVPRRLGRQHHAVSVLCGTGSPDTG